MNVSPKGFYNPFGENPFFANFNHGALENSTLRKLCYNIVKKQGREK